jgi:hypothetical protein
MATFGDEFGVRCTPCRQVRFGPSEGFSQRKGMSSDAFNSGGKNIGATGGLFEHMRLLSRRELTLL